MPIQAAMKLVTALLALSLTACAAGGSRSEPRRLLLSYDGPAAQVPATPRPRLVLRAVNLPDYLDRREMVRRRGAAEIVLDQSAYWAERPSKAITRWVSLALAVQRPDYAVESYTTADGRAPDALLSLTLENFAPDAEGVVRLRGAWTFSPNGKVSTRSGRFDADQPTSNGSAEASVAALQRALAAAVNSLATQLPEAVFATERPR